MSRKALNLALLAGFFGTVALNFTFRGTYGKPNWEFAPDMAHSPRSNAFSASSVFADGKTLREPPAGTIPRGLPPLHYAATPQDALRAGAELKSPFGAGGAAVLQRGPSVYTNFCTPCHGAGGRGDGPVARRGFPPPPSLLAEHAVAMADGQMFHVLTYGQANMPSYASQLSREDRWKVIAYVRSLQRPPASTAGVP